MLLQAGLVYLWCCIGLYFYVDKDKNKKMLLAYVMKMDMKVVLFEFICWWRWDGKISLSCFKGDGYIREVVWVPIMLILYRYLVVSKIDIEMVLFESIWFRPERIDIKISLSYFKDDGIGVTVLGHMWMNRKTQRYSLSFWQDGYKDDVFLMAFVDEQEWKDLILLAFNRLNILVILFNFISWLIRELDDLENLLLHIIVSRIGK